MHKIEDGRGAGGGGDRSLHHREHRAGNRRVIARERYNLMPSRPLNVKW